MADQRHDIVDPGGGPVYERFSERLERFFSACARTILDAVGPDRARCIFLCGSFAGGEGSVAVRGEGSPLFLSDVDLVLVVDSTETHAAVYPGRREIAAACEKQFPEARFAGHVDIGVLLAGELPSLAPSPGVFDMRRLGRVLYGDASVLGLLPEPDPGSIGADAARLLCENRIASLLGAAQCVTGDGRSDDPVLRYAISRAYTDIATAELCSAGAYRSGYRERLRWIRDDPAAAPVRETLGPRLLERIGEGTAYKLRPMGVGETAAERAAGWREAASDILAAWRRAAAASAGLDPNAAESRSIEALLEARPRTGPKRDVLRSWMAFETVHRGKPRLRALPGALMRSFGPAPDEMVRREAVRLLADAAIQGISHRVARAPGGFPHTGGSWREAASATSLAWRLLVHGREG